MSDKSSVTCNPPEEARGSWFSLQVISKYIVVAALVLLVIYFQANNRKFLSEANITNILKQMSPLLIAAAGTTFVILMGSIDLSIDGVVTLAGITAVLTANATKDMGAPGVVLPVFAGMGVGLLVGLINGTLQARLRLPSFLVTLGMSTICSGIGLITTNGAAIRALGNGYKRIATTTVWVFPVLWLIAIAFFAVGYALSRRSLFGRYSYAIGGGERVAELCGIPIARYKTLVFMFAGVLSGLAGALTSSRLGAATNIQGNGMALDAIAAVVMGGTALSGGKGGVLNTLIGVLVIVLLANGLNMMGVQPYTQTLIKGVVVILAVALTAERKKVVVK